MKKSIIILIIFVCGIADMMAQDQKGKLSIKPMVGVNFSNFGNATIDMYQMKVGLTGGAELEYGINPWLGLSLGLMYSQQGAKIDGSFDAMVADDSGNRWLTNTQMNGKLKCDYLNLPLMANVYIPAIKGLAFKAGVQVGILASDKMTVDGTIAMINTNYASSTFEYVDGAKLNQISSYSTSITDVCKSVDFGIPLGLSYEYKNVVLDARYFFGLTKIDKTDDPDSARNQYLSITLGYKFNLK